MTRIKIGRHWVGAGDPTYFIADIAANHDGELMRAVDLIHQAAQAGANGAKFQHFRASQIVSRQGFEALGSQVSHQEKWRQPVYEVYKAASLPWEWTAALQKACQEAELDFLSAPYDPEAVDMLDPFLAAYKIGSGDITWIEILENMARRGKPVLLATGASSLADVQRAANAILALNPDLILMQCNTNYTGSLENFRFVRLNVLKTYAAMYPGAVLGLSDHTPGHAAVLGAVALGARVVEKHFTDDTCRQGPDHGFSLDPRTFREMVDRTRELEYALGDGNKQVEDNEQETMVIQRRCLRAARDLAAGRDLTRADLEVLRPAPRDALFPYELPLIIGRRLSHGVSQGDYLKWSDLE